MTISAAPKPSKSDPRAGWGQRGGAVVAGDVVAQTEQVLQLVRRLAARELDWTPEDAAQSSALLIPARTLAEVAKTLSGAGTVEIALSAGDGMLGITGGGRRATTRLLDAEFPRFTQHLLEMVYPHYLAPTPSMAVVRLDPDLKVGSLAEGFTGVKSTCEFPGA